MPKKGKCLKVSDVLNKWLQPRIESKLENGITAEQALEDIVKEIAINSLSQLPLPLFSSSMIALAQLGDKNKLEIMEKIIAISPNPEFATKTKTTTDGNDGSGGNSVVADKIRDYLILKLLSSSTSSSLMLSSSSQEDSFSSKVSIEIKPKLMDIAKTVLQNSYNNNIRKNLARK
nr:10698_t:CDS:1 [Entrophospora candida]CAG8483430.1 13514_t:CDS:1 [Entrophospora candida]